MFAQQRREFGYLYVYLPDACHIADSDRPSVIEHMRAGSRISFPATLIANISLVTARLRSWPIDVVVKGDTSPPSSRKRKREEGSGPSCSPYFPYRPAGTPGIRD